jgi:hypothetical protein
MLNDAQALCATSIGALGTPDAVAQIQTISATADCTAPRGTYLTEIHSGRGGRIWFKQTWANRTPLVIVINPQGGWATDTTTGETQSIDATDIAQIRGHEFQMLPLTLSERFTDAHRDGASEWNGTPCLVVRGRDDLNMPTSLYFRTADSRWAGMELTNARHPDQTVRVVVHTWVEVGGVLLPSNITASDASGDYHFDFRNISVNTVDESVFQTPQNAASPAQ